MKFSDIMIYYNYNMTNVARALGITKQYVSSWKKSGIIPFSKQCELEVITNGDLKAHRKETEI